MAALAHAFVGSNIFQRGEDEGQRCTDVVCGVDEEIYFLLVVTLLQSVAVVVPTHIDEPE